MSLIDAMRTRLSRASEAGVPSHEFLKHELDEGVALKSHVNLRVARAGRETEEAVRQLQHELNTPDEAVMRLAARQTAGD
jgi:hypothetical protein